MQKKLVTWVTLQLLGARRQGVARSKPDKAICSVIFYLAFGLFDSHRSKIDRVWEGWHLVLRFYFLFSTFAQR